jgi:membrane protein
VGTVRDTVRDTVRPVAQRGPAVLLRRTWSKAWSDRIFGLSAEAGFWQLLSVPPLFLAMLGSLGFVGNLIGPQTVDRVEQQLLETFGRAFTPEVVADLITPIVHDVLRKGRLDVVSVGFVLSLWAGSSATATFVNTITIAYGMRDERGAVRSRLLALWLYLLTVLIGVLLLPLLVLGPGELVRLAPGSVRSGLTWLVGHLYWPVAVLLLLLGLVTFYHLAPPRRLRWRQGLPGAVLAMGVFVLGGFGLRRYIAFVVGRAFTFGTLAAPIAALLFLYLLAFAVLLGAELNATIDQLWPAGPTRRERRRAAAAEPAEPAEPAPAEAPPAGATPADATPAGATHADATPAGATPAGATRADAADGQQASGGTGARAAAAADADVAAVSAADGYPSPPPGIDS